MSWDARLEYKDESLGDWNCTHNCNRMMATVLEENGHKLEKHWLIGHMGNSWFDVLDKMSGTDGAVLLSVIVSGMEAEPKRFRDMNPANNWGNYDGALEVLREMLTTSRECPNAIWSVSG